MPYVHWAMDSVLAQRFSEPTWDIPGSMDPEKNLVQKIQVTGKLAEGWLALRFGEADLQI